MGVKILRSHDQAVVNMAKSLYPDAFVSFVSPDKTISYYVSKIGSKISDYENSIVKYPIVTVQRVMFPEIDAMRYATGVGLFAHRKWKYLDESKSIVHKVKRFVPLRLSYQWDILCESGKFSMMNELLERFLIEMETSTYTSIPLIFLQDDNSEDPVYGSILAHINYDSISDNSELETSDPRDKRSLRYSITFTLDGWAPRGYETVKTVLHVETEEEVF